MSKNVLITGGAGFIGQALTRKLLKRGYNLTILDNLDPQVHGINAQYNPQLSQDVHFINGDILNDIDIERALEGQDFLIHLAAHTATAQSMYKISEDMRVNVLGAAKIMEYLIYHSHNIKKVIFASSRAVYGEGAYQCNKCGFVHPPKRSALHMEKGEFEQFCPYCNTKLIPIPTKESCELNPLSIYGSSKVAAEQLITISAQTLGIPYTILRYQNVYGQGQSLSNPYTGILSVFASRILNNKPIYIFEDGKESRDFVHVDDVAYATMQVMENRKTDNKIYNIGTGIAITVLDVAQLLLKKININNKYIINGNFRVGDIRHNFADISKAQQDFNFSPQIDINLGIEMFIDWLKTQKIPYDSFDRSLRELEGLNMLGGGTSYDVTKDRTMST